MPIGKLKIGDTFCSWMSPGSVFPPMIVVEEFGGGQVNDLFNVPYKKWNGLVVDQLWFGVESIEHLWDNLELSKILLARCTSYPLGCKKFGQQFIKRRLLH
jgi:hypothetical protein